MPGVISWEGHFKKEDVVIVEDENKNEIARGMINYSTTDLEKITDKKAQPEVIHRDHLVLCQR